MEALSLSIADLELGPVVSAWGAQSVQEVLPKLSGVGCHVAVRGSRADAVRLFRSAQLLRADPGTMLDLLPGGQEVGVIEADTPVSRLPAQRPLVVASAGEVIGILLSDHAPPVRGPQPTAVFNAAEVALREVKRAMVEFRRKGVPLIIDVRDSRVHGSADVLTDLLQTLLADILEHVESAGGDGAAHVMLSPGRSGTWLVVEDRCGRLSDEVQIALADPGAWCDDPLVRSFRRLKERVEGMGGSMSAQPGPFGMRTLVALPGPTMPGMG